MDLSENGKLLRNLRKAKGMTQKQIADSLGIQPKTVSKWETGHGFPDVSTLSALADLLGVSESTLLSGRLVKNACEVGNMKKLKFYVCPHCGSFFSGAGRKPCRLLRQTAQTVGGKAGGRKACGHGFRNRGRFLRRV